MYMYKGTDFPDFLFFCLGDVRHLYFDSRL